MRRLLPLVCGLAVAMLYAPAAADTPAFRLTDPRLDEISGIAAGIRSPGVVYVQNDSGDTARFFALDARSGRVLATYTVPGVTAVDWEDLAVAPDADGTPSVWLADIGDNDRARDEIELYRVDEPAVDPSGPERAVTTKAPDVWTLHYPAAANDAESLAVSPQGVPYVITKSLDGRSVVFTAPPTPGDATLERTGRIQFGFTGTPGPFAPIGQLTATGAALSSDGTRFAVRTYTDAYLWTVVDGDLGAALRTHPVRFPLPEQPQGEGICFAGNDFLLDSEDVGSEVYRIPLPAVRASEPAPSAVPTPIASQPASVPAADVTHTPSLGPWSYLLASVAAAAVAALGAIAWRRRRT